MSLRYGYVTNGLADHRLVDALELLAESGYDGVAISLDHHHFDPFAPEPQRRARLLRARLERLGLTAVVETGARYLLDPRRKHFPTMLEGERERRLDFLRTAIEIAAELGAPVVSIWSGTASERLSRDLAWERLVEGCADLVGHAREHGVTVGFEPEPGMLVSSLSEFEQLARDLDHPPELGLTLDLGHCVCLEPEPVDVCIRRGADHLVHVHAEDMLAGIHEHLPFGAGELDLEAALNALGAFDYRGMVAVELSRNSHEAHWRVPESIKILRRAEGAATGALEQVVGGPAPPRGSR